MKKLLKALAIIAAPAAGLLAAATVTGSGLATALHTSTDSGGDHKVTICHHVEGNGNTGNGFNIISVDKDSIVNVEGVLNGHGLHELDIIPAFPAGNDGPHSWGSFPGRGDASLIGQNCGGEETSTSTTTDTSSTSTTETVPPPPPPGTTTVPHGGPRCPPGQGPFAGKDGEPGNQECCPDANNDQRCDEEVPPSTSSTSQNTTPTTTTSQGTTETTSTQPSSPPPPGPVSKPKPKAKPKPKIVKIPGGSAAPGYVPKIVHGHPAITGSG